MDTSNDISQDAWDKARHFLSVGFTIPISHRLSETIALATNINDLESYDYKMVTWEEFIQNDDIPLAFFERAEQWRESGGFDFVVYDPLDDENGYMIVGNDANKLALEACEYIANSEPENGPLSTDKFAMAKIEGV